MFRKAVLPAGAAEPRATPRAWFAGVAGRLLDAAVLKAHALAVRFDRVPDSFGVDVALDEADPKALRREWLRQLHLWADYSPEQVFALKAGALMLGAVLAVLLIVVAVI